MSQQLLAPLKPWLRRLKYSSLRQRAEWQANWAPISEPDRGKSNVAFIIGCGRSGTTVLGTLLAQHRQIHYWFEPYHLWAAVDRRTDTLNLYHRQPDARLIWTDAHWREPQQRRFNRLFGRLPQNRLGVEKTPLNALRLGWLESLAPNARYIHLVRDGRSVCASIQRLASTNTYKMAGLPDLNQWWGVGQAKWKALQRDGKAQGYFPDAADYLEKEEAKAAYEWLVSLGEVHRWRSTLGSRLLEITYPQLVTQPEQTLNLICQFLNLACPPSWLSRAAITLHPQRSPLPSDPVLPPTMQTAFSHYQEHYGFLEASI